MTQLLRYTLIADGSSDSVLMPIIDWLLAEHAPLARISGTFATFRQGQDRALSARITTALREFPCDLLFIHRDAEGASLAQRKDEISIACEGLDIKTVPIIPVHMTEAWMFADEAAIRFASENASGTHRISIPAKRQWESMADPKAALFEVLIEASAKSGRALKKFNPEKARTLIAQRATQFKQLRGLSSFDAFEQALTQQLVRLINALD